MNIIKLDATDSTNSYLRRLSVNEPIADYTVVVTKLQTSGRGQMGTVWDSEASKNLTFSVYKDLSEYHLESPFYISMAIALALYKTLSSLSIPKLSVKWPNDILSENKKICGILIENVFKQHKFSSTIIGIGLNVNQVEFDNLPKASSLKLVSGSTFDLDDITKEIIINLKYYFNILKERRLVSLKETYEASLFRKNKPSTFQDAEGVLFFGIIKGVSEYGNLQVLLEDEMIKEFDLKTITLLY
ncbi:BirA family biotin operon repressor/biotin-[acetyl-CoA-carboxylase] ligase [Mariniflexile fucanivorans]|uniref:BirA family biotin operon repressor/biotin-[acetyl-CoA-carboxylase] ligase n=1 Tax=Mariniflexile fucanivorans TaxID=264023 RepID=A0A4R1REL9_9FLAO|nr:biotin--[acetyl-CoA-carboxylase] ligase [Mariniflexile fucanivorans]TCL64374.1 BirA family biotin operon repressor/biotin-[acetyl-CoA-carboxylase] ligase [Mariniflexile fucanivorans]